MIASLFILAVILYLFWYFHPQVDYIQKSDMYILWYNAGDNQRKWIKLWGI